jgi:hypothetical protein
MVGAIDVKLSLQLNFKSRDQLIQNLWVRAMPITGRTNWAAI